MHDQTKTGKHPRLGRPPKPRDEVRSERVVSFVTPVEFDALNELAEEREESLSALIHEMLLSALARQLPKSGARGRNQP